MRYLTLLLVFGGTTTARHVGMSDARLPAAEPPADVQKKPTATPPRGNVPIAGFVTAVSDKSITIRGIEAEFRGLIRTVVERERVTSYGNPISFITSTRTIKGVMVVGTDEGFSITDAEGRVVVVREQDQVPRIFAISKELAEGGRRKWLTPGDQYRLQDVKVGDYVGIRFNSADGVDTCMQIQICKRPGGLVPPSPYDEGDINGLKYHEFQNAHNEWREHGTPIPDKFLSRWALEERRSKIAPMPREVIPRIPEAQP